MEKKEEKKEEKKAEGLAQKKGDDVPDHAGDLDDAKYKHQFNGHNDYNANAPAANHYPDTEYAPKGNAHLSGLT